MEYLTQDYSELHKDTIAMMPEEWDRAYGLDDEGVMQVFFEGMTWPDGFLDCLKGLSIDEQLEHYAISDSSEYSRSSYGEIDKSKSSSSSLKPLKDYKYFRGVILKDHVIIGAIISDYRDNLKYLYPGRPACLYLSVDNDGTGSSSSSVYAYLHCLPVDFCCH